MSELQTDPIADLVLKNRDYAHPDHPLLSSRYSPSSLVPCADFTPFIIDKLRAGDVHCLGRLTGGLLGRDPLHMADDRELAGAVQAISDLPLSTYVAFDPPSGELDLKAQFLVADKGSGMRGFWLTNDTAWLFASATCCFRPVWNDNSEMLVKRANTFIRKMRREAPFWTDYPLFKPACWKVDPPPDSPLLGKLRTLTVASRRHLRLLNLRSPARADECTSYPMRAQGIVVQETTDELVNAGILRPAGDVAALANVLTKDQIVAMCDGMSVSYRKSWKKDQLLHALDEAAPGRLADDLRNLNVHEINPACREELGGLMRYADSLETPIGLLFFA